MLFIKKKWLYNKNKNLNELILKINLKKTKLRINKLIKKIMKRESIDILLFNPISLNYAIIIKWDPILLTRLMYNNQSTFTDSLI